MIITIDHSDTTALYQQISRQITDQIEAGAVLPGEKLPTAGDLAASLELNRNTVLQAYRQLRDQGAIELRRGRGAVVLDNSPQNHSMASAVENIVDIAKKRGLNLNRVTDLLKESGLS